MVAGSITFRQLKAMAKRPIFIFSVTQIQKLSPSFQRISFQSDDFTVEKNSLLADAHPGDYIKLCLPKAEQFVPLSVDNVDLASMYKRSYSIRSLDVVKGILTMDFAKHVPCGPAGDWMANVAVGDQVAMTGPGPVQRLNQSADSFLVIADVAGLPAAIANIEALAPEAKGLCIFEVPHADDQLEFKCPKDMTVSWSTTAGAKPEHIKSLLEELDWPAGLVSIWAAAEYSLIKKVREILQPKKISSQFAYLSSYWKLNASDEEHKASKKKLSSAS